MRSFLNGFTSIELLVVIAIVGLLMAIGLPGMGVFITKSRMDAEINALASGLNFARGEAVKRGLQVSVCAVLISDTTLLPGLQCGTTSAYDTGWMVKLTDPSLTGSALLTLQVTPAMSHGESLQAYASTGGVLAATTYPTFFPIGYTFFPGTFSLHDSNSTPSLYRCITFATGFWTVQPAGTACP